MIRLIRSYIRDSCGPSSIPWASIFFLSFSLSLSVCLSVYLSFSLSFCPCPQRCSGDWGDAVRRGCWAFDLFLIRLLCFAISYFIPGPSSHEIAVSEARCSEMLGEARRCSERRASGGRASHFYFRPGSISWKSITPLPPPSQRIGIPALMRKFKTNQAHRGAEPSARGGA